MTLTNPETVNKNFVSPGKSKVINGSILSPQASTLKIILAPASETGKPEGELYKLFDKKWKTASAELKGWHQHHIDFKLGNNKTVALQSDTWLTYALFLDKDGVVNEAALDKCLKTLAANAKYEKATVHISTLSMTAYPQLSEGLVKHCLDNGVSLFLYEEPAPVASR